MITEDYVSLDTAKLLEEKGFDGILPCVYIDTKKSDKKPILLDTLCNYNDGHIKDVISAPTLQMAMKWLRVVHHYYIQVMLDGWACGGHLGYYVVIQKTDSDFEMMLQDVRERVFYDTPEEAAEDAIMYIAENLI